MHQLVLVAFVGWEPVWMDEAGVTRRGGWSVDHPHRNRFDNRYLPNGGGLRYLPGELNHDPTPRTEPDRIPCIGDSTRVQIRGLTEFGLWFTARVLDCGVPVL